MVWVCLLLALQVGTAQKRPAANSPEDTRRVLIEKAHALEARGRPDMAIQSWQQILLSDPNNTEALGGLARDYKLIGSGDQSNSALERLRRVNPNDPNIGKIASLNSTRAQSDRLRQAGELARQGKPEEAMKIYRELYGDRPPDGDIALAYYQTLYGTASGKEAAIAAMRALAQRNPGDTRFSVELGTMLTYSAKTRAEGIHDLEAHPKDPNAQAALRQALIWDAANPSSAAELRQYLKDHPQDTELAGHLKEDESKLAQMNSGIARTPAEKAAFAALNAHKLEDAQARFNAILEQEPKNGRAAAGLGFLRMQQSNFGGAISYLTQAEQNGYKDRAVEDALATSRFWYTMGAASQAFDENQFDVAAAKYKVALGMRPRSPEALNGLAGLYVKQAQYTAAAGVYDELLKVQPGSAAAWRGLFLAYARDGQNRKALDLTGRFPAQVRASLAKDPEYLRTLATIYHAENRPADAQHALSLALSLPYPDNGTNLKADTRLQYAGVLMEAKRFEQAADMYAQILNEDAGSLSAWMGLVSAHHELAQDNQAIADVEKMPPATYDSALADPGFLSMLGAIYQQANQFDIAQGLLERSAKLQFAAGGQPAIPLQLQLAAIYLQRNNTAQAYAIYHQILLAHPERVDAWKGLIASLQATNRNTEAIDEIALIPPAVRKELETDIEFVQGEASLYAATGDIAHATEYMNRVLVHYRDLKSQPPSNIDVQNAWLLFNTGNDRALYPALMRLGGRQDLTVTQREAVQSIWANWSVRRAGTAMDNGNVQRAVDILDAAAQAFPDNMTVRKAVAGGYVKVGRAKESLALFKTIPMQDASAGDFQGAIGAALSANDKAQAEIWLRQALDRYPRNPAVLSLAARFEQARGDNQRAVDYWKASLAAMPQASPADRLAHTLVYPDQDGKARRAVTAADLQHLLDPNYEPFQKTTKLPPLPAYGADPYSGRAPVDLSQPQTVQPQNQWANPSTTENPPSNGPDVNSAGTNPPMAQAPGLPVEGRTDIVQAQVADLPAGKTAYSSSRTRKPAGKTNYMGTMHVPAADRNIRAPRPAEPVGGSANLQQPFASVSQGRLTRTLSLQPANEPAPLSFRSTGNSLASHATKGLIFIPMPVLAEQKEKDPVFFRHVSYHSQDAQNSANSPKYSGQVKLPPSEENVDTTDPDQSQPQTPSRKPKGTQASQTAPPLARLRISSQPMGDLAARTQALFAEQTDAQLTQGSAANLRAQDNAAVKPTPTPSAPPSGSIRYAMAQYTPSAQEAATGAYSAPKKQTQGQTQPQQQSQPQTICTQCPAPAAALALKKAKKQAKPAMRPAPVPTLETAPAAPLPQQPEVNVTELPGQAAATTGTGLSDQELQERNLPPLRGPWVRVQRDQRTVSPRDEAEMQLRSIESGYSSWMGGTGTINYRSGDLGFDHLSALEAPFEASLSMGYNARLTIVAKPVFLDSGQANGSSVIQVLEAASPGLPLTLTTIPQPIGSLTATDTTPPAQQSATGIGGEVQLAFPHLAIAGGYTPSGFLVATFTGRALWKPGNGPITFNFSRDSVKDTQLSYGGLRDPLGNTLGNLGQIWGGVIANQGNVQFAHGDAQSGFYIAGGGQYITGFNVATNNRMEGSGGAYWRVKTIPEYGNLSIGANFFGMHYAKNQDAFTFGMGGYFSPQAYFLANAPITWNAHSGTAWHYNILGSLGVQAFQVDQTALFPNNVITAYLPAKTSVGPNYDLRAQAAYQISPHWFAGGFLGANNSRNYSAATAGFYVHFLFRAQPSTVTTPTGIFPTDGMRPFMVP
jgi:tetratricopeptide (TPR) repeat protein